MTSLVVTPVTQLWARGIRSMRHGADPHSHPQHEKGIACLPQIYRGSSTRRGRPTCWSSWRPT
jgi:hypothetical protein